MTDLLLSSGFLAFARHAGVLLAVEEAGLEVGAVVGTSSGALVGALWAAGMPAARIADELEGKRPFDLMGWHGAVWRGLFTMEPLRQWLTERLPADFADLRRPLAVGVARGGQAGLLHEGPLVDAVATSCAMPWIFASPKPGFVDGGAVDRLMFGPWRNWRGERPVLAHLVERSAGRDPAELPERVIRTPRSGASFWSLGDVPGQVAEARDRARAVLRG